MILMIMSFVNNRDLSKPPAPPGSVMGSARIIPGLAWSIWIRTILASYIYYTFVHDREEQQKTGFVRMNAFKLQHGGVLR
jgi:hypothetical protein